MRWYFAFLRGWPGVGTFVLRLALAGTLLTSSLFGEHGPTSAILVRSMEFVAAVLLLLGLWSPLAATFIVVLQTVILMGIGPRDDAFLKAAIGLAVLFLGPGTWSLDARIYGRRRVEIQTPSDN